MGRGGTLNQLTSHVHVSQYDKRDLHKARVGVAALPSLSFVRMRLNMVQRGQSKQN